MKVSYLQKINKNKLMKKRLDEFLTDLEALTYSDMRGASASSLKVWLKLYVSYVHNGGDRPPHKPPTP
jgi:hypothetical protein